MSGFKWHPGMERRFDAAVASALAKTAEAVKTDLVQSQTLPFDTGQLQGSVFADVSSIRKGRASVVTNTPYARRLYYHPEYNFSKADNPRAGGEWYRTYLPGGAKQGFAARAFSSFLGRAL